MSDHNPSPHFITVDNASGAALCSTSAMDPLDPTWLENAPGLQHPMMLAKWDAVRRASLPRVPPPYPPYPWLGSCCTPPGTPTRCQHPVPSSGA